MAVAKAVRWRVAFAQLCLIFLLATTTVDVTAASGDATATKDAMSPHARSKDEQAGVAQLNALNQLYADILQAHLSVGEKNGKALNLIDYFALRRDARMPDLLDAVKNFPRSHLDSPERKMAFYLNAYNILAMHKVAKHWPLKKLKALGTFYKPVWTHHAGKVCGESMTLRELEHEVLRKMGDPRIHFAINCASVSCPDLRAEPYVAEQLNAQLEDQTQRFLSQPGKGLTIEGHQLHLSPLFLWFEEDFAPVGGVLPFLEQYLPSPPATAKQGWEIASYFDYDWEVNDHLTTMERKQIKRGKDNWFN